MFCASHSEAARKVTQVDEMWLDFVRKLFAGMGFTGNEVEARIHPFGVFHSPCEGFYVKNQGV